MMINFWAILVTGVAQMILGAIWYGPLFGKTWGRIIGLHVEHMDAEAKKNMQKRMIPVYILNFILCLVTSFALLIFIIGWNFISPLIIAGIIWLGFVMPIAAGAAMWSGKSRKIAWEMFGVTAGFQLISFALAALVLGTWM